MTPPTPRPLVFLDTETTSLRPDRQIWEVAAIREVADPTAAASPEEEVLEAFLPVDLSGADPTSLAIGRFYERHPYGRVLAGSEEPRDLAAAEHLGRGHALMAAGAVARLTHGAIIVGAVPWFDTERGLDRLLRRNGMLPGWHYHLVDVETLAAGALRMAPPWDFDLLLREFGLTYLEEDRHTALGDARMVQRLYWAVLAGRAQ